jgi:hypothetical protein
MNIWESYIEDGIKKYGWRLTCQNCKRVFHRRRSDAATCSANCRKTLSRAPLRKLTAIADIEAMGRRANEIANTYPHSQDMFDQMVILKQAIDRAINSFEVKWEQRELPPDS